jgi:hypothetical protein
MAAPEPLRSQNRRPSKEVIKLQHQIRGLLARCEDPRVEGCWIDMIGREEHYLDASLCRREAGLSPLPGRRMISADWPVEPDWDALELLAFVYLAWSGHQGSVSLPGIKLSMEPSPKVVSAACAPLLPEITVLSHLVPFPSGARPRGVY